MQPIKLNILKDEREMLTPVSSAISLLVANKSSYFCRTPYEDRLVKNYRGGGNSRIGGDMASDVLMPDNYPYGPVDIYSVLDVYYYPEYGVMISEDGHVFHQSMEEAWYFSQDLSKLPYIERRDGQSVFVPPDDAPYLERAVITFPWGGNGNYGHFLLDCLSGLSVIRDTLPEIRGPFVFPALKHWHFDHLQTFDIDYMILKRPVYRVKRAIYSTCMGHFLLKCTEDLDLVNVLAEREDHAVEAPTESIYLSRKGNPKRRFVGEEALEAFLAGQGYPILRPESMSVGSQIAAFRDAKIVLGNTGAAFANIIYCRPGTVVIEVQPRGMHSWWVRQICLVKGLRWSGYFVDATFLNLESPELGMIFNYKNEDLWDFVQSVVAE